MKKQKIKFPLNEQEKERIIDRVKEVLNKKSGTQVIIVLDEDKMTDYYQNVCVPFVLRNVKASVEEYAEIAPGLVSKHE